MVKKVIKKLLKCYIILSLLLLPVVLIIILIEAPYSVEYLDIDEIVHNFSDVHGDETSFACELDYEMVRFENRSIDLKKIDLGGDFCGGISRDAGNVFIALTSSYNDEKVFKIVSTDYNLKIKEVVFEKKIENDVEAISYNRIIYFYDGKKYAQNEFDIEGYDLVKREYLGVVFSTRRLQDIAYLFRTEQSPYIWETHSKFGKKKFIDIKKKETGEKRTISEERLTQDDVGSIIVRHNGWYFKGIYWLENRLYLRCCISAKNNSSDFYYPFFNIIYEYDFDDDKLIFKFYFASNDVEGHVELLI